MVEDLIDHCRTHALQCCQMQKYFSLLPGNGFFDSMVESILQSLDHEGASAGGLVEQLPIVGEDTRYHRYQFMADPVA